MVVVNSSTERGGRQARRPAVDAECSNSGVCSESVVEVEVNVTEDDNSVSVTKGGNLIPAALDNLVERVNKLQQKFGKKKTKNRSRALQKKVDATVQTTLETTWQERPAQQTLQETWATAAPDRNEEIKDLSFLLPWGDVLADRAPETTLQVVYQNEAHSFVATGEDPGVSSFTENLVALNAGMAMCSETNVNGRSVKNTLRERRTLRKSFRVHMSTNSSDVGDTPEAMAKRKLPGGSALFTFDHCGHRL